MKLTKNGSLVAIAIVVLLGGAFALTLWWFIGVMGAATG